MINSGKHKRKVSPKVIAGLAGLQLMVGFLTLRDIRRRTGQQVRGPRPLWMLWGTTNTFGALMYWLLGRRRITAGDRPD